MTFVRIGQFEALPGTTEALRQIYETQAIPVIRQAAGNISALLLQQHRRTTPRPMTKAARRWRW
jgi:hypothetical protein